MSHIPDGSTIVCWFSCGAASAVAARYTIDQYGNRCTVRVVNTPVAEEDEDNRRFLVDVEKWLGQPIEIATAAAWPTSSAVEVWEKRKFMSGPKGAPCTLELKKKARQEFEQRVKVDYHVLGFTVEEQDRHNRFSLFERDNTIPVLIDAGLRKQDCLTILLAAGIEPPRCYRQGYPNANCIGCVKATSATYWSLVREKHPEIFTQRAEQSRRIGCKLVRHNGKRIFLDELPAGAKGRGIKGMDFDCGIFCMEKPK